MNSYLDCIPCFVRQALDAARMASDDPAFHEKMLRHVLRLTAEMDLSDSPPVIGQRIHRKLRDLTGIPDPYAGVKRRFNRMALDMLPELRSRIAAAEDPFATAVRLAITGNIIDFGPKGNTTEQDALDAISNAFTEPFHGDLLAFQDAVEHADTILYLADNAGEIVFDRVLVEEILPKRVTFAVRGAPVINDATLEDAEAAGLTRLSEVIDNGSDGPGTILSDCSTAFLERFRAADIIISKGQGNFETLSEESAPLFFLFKAKCPVIAAHAGVPLGAQVLSRRQRRGEQEYTSMHSESDRKISDSPAASERKCFQMRGFFSLLLFSSFTVLLFTGLILYVTPKGRVANWTGWAVLGLEKEQWSAIHMTSALVVIITAGFHLYYNWGVFWSYIKRKAQGTFNLKREMALALLLCVVTVFGTICNLPPFSMIVQWNEDIKAYWETRSAAGPMPHAEELSIAQLAEKIGIPLDQVVERLKNAGVTVGDTSMSVDELAAAHGMTPSDLFALVKPGLMRRMGSRGSGAGGSEGRGHAIPAVGVTELGAGIDEPGKVKVPADGGHDVGGVGRGKAAAYGVGKGYGRMTVGQCCEGANITVQEGLTRLKDAGVEASSGESIKETSERSGKKPLEIVQIIERK